MASVPDDRSGNGDRRSLGEKLAALHLERLRTWDPAALAINIDQRAELVAAARTPTWAPAGTRLPDLPLIDVATGAVGLHALARRGPLALIFFRFATCPACNIALPHYARTLWPELVARDIGLIAVTPQLPDRLATIGERHSLPFALASDPDNGLARALGITFVANAATRAQAQPGQPWLGEVTGTGTWELPQPAVLLIDEAAVLRWIDVSPDWLARTESSAVIAAADRFIKPRSMLQLLS